MMPDWNAIAGVTNITSSPTQRLVNEAEWIVQHVQLSLKEIAGNVSEIERIQQELKK